MRKLILVAIALPLLGCNPEPLGPGGGPVASQSDLGLVTRGDSLTKGGYAAWRDGSLSYYVFVSEARFPANGTMVWLAYGAYDSETFESAFYGSGYVSPKDVVGSGQGFLRLSTSTDPTVYPDFDLSDHPGGAIDLVWNAIPQTSWRWHETGTVDLGPWIIKYTTGYTSRDAEVAGSLLGMSVPAGATGNLWQTVDHGMVLQPGN